MSKNKKIESHYIIYVDTNDKISLDRTKDIVQSMVNKLALHSRVFTIVSGCGSLKYLYQKKQAKDIAIKLEHSGGCNVFDAIKKIILKIDEEKIKLDKIFILVSESADNSSETTFEEIVEFMKIKRKNGWDFWMSGNDFNKTNEFHNFTI